MNDKGGKGGRTELWEMIDRWKRGFWEDGKPRDPFSIILEVRAAKLCSLPSLAYGWCLGTESGEGVGEEIEPPSAAKNSSIHWSTNTLFRPL